MCMLMPGRAWRNRGSSTDELTAGRLDFRQPASKGLSHSPPEADSGLGGAEVGLSLSKAMADVTMSAPGWFDHFHPHMALSGADGSRR